MGKYDELIGGVQMSIGVDDILAEQQEASNTRRKLVEQLIILTEEDIEARRHPVFCNEEWAKEDICYLEKFISYLQEYLAKL